MKRIMLACSAGMSTSMMVQRMKDYAKDQGIEVEIFALSSASAFSQLDKVDAILLGPQIRFEKSRFDKIVDGKIPLEVIDMVAYGKMDGAAVFKNIWEKIK